MKKERVLVTGGAGYLGSILVPDLLEAGYAVTVVDNLMWAENSLAHVCHRSEFDFVNGDARDERLMGGVIESADIVIPLAALVGAPLCDKDQTGAVSTNLEAVRMLCRRMTASQRILVPITNSGYGIGEKGKFCTEETPLRPVSLYGRTKVEAEQAVLAHPNAISFRLATVFGMAPRMRIDLLVNDFCLRAVKDSAVVLFEAHAKRNYIHIRDVSRVFLHGIANFDAMKGRPYNVGLSSANLSKWELCEAIRELVPSFVFMEAAVGEDPDKRDYIVSNERVEATGWTPAYSLDDGIRELVKGYRMLKTRRYANV